MLFSTTSSISITVVAAVAASSLLYQDIPVVASVVEVELDLQGEQKQQQEEVAVDESHHPTNANEYDDDVVLCGVWLAPSTIEGAGLGMFAGTDYQTGEELIPGGDSVIAIVDLSHHNHFSRDLYGPFLWDEYTWMASALKMGSEGYSEINVASAGFGAAVNCILPIYNVNEWFPVLTDLQLHRSKDAGAGAMTAFHQRKSTARRPISAGEEIFVSCAWNTHVFMPFLLRFV